ncbi:MAG: plasmid mobilization protein [Brevinema sp.]
MPDRISHCEIRILQKISALIFRLRKVSGCKARKEIFQEENTIMGKRKEGMARQNRTIRLSESELQKLADGANAAGMSESEYVRHLIMQGGVDVDYIRDRQNIIRQITGVATNINQAAKWANENKYIPQSRIDQMCMQLGVILGLLKELIQLWR